MKIRSWAYSAVVALLWVIASAAQTVPVKPDSSHQPPSPLKIPDDETVVAEPVPAKLDTITVILDTTVIHRDTASTTPDSATIRAESAAKAGDSDGDGLPDSLDHCPNTPHGLSVGKTGCLVMTELNRRLVLHVTYFPGTTKPDPYTLSILDDLIIRLRDSSQVRVTIEGYTDNIGEDSANLVVSQKRADKVKAYLVKNGIAASRIDAIGLGETKPIADNKTASGRRKNRRIEFTFHRAE